MVPVVSWGPEPLSIEAAMGFIGTRGRFGVLNEDLPEGAVWRAETRGQYNFMAKYVRPEKVDGKYIPQFSDQPEPIWHVPLDCQTPV